jgi:ATP-dependent protease HslVU (ClpYQ) peptidase subunit
VTTIAALAVTGRIVFGADTLTNVYERPILNGARKVFRRRCTKGGELLLGVCGAGALADVMRVGLTVDSLPGSDPDDQQAWATAVCWAVTDLAVERGLTDQGQMDGSVLLGAVGRLWTMSNSHAIPHHDGVATLGSGEGPAIGALDVLRQQPGFDPRDAVERAVRIGAARDKHSALPLVIEELVHET